MVIAGSREAGFTLLELLVVLAVIGLLAVVAPPYVQGALSRIEAEQATDAVAAALAEGRTLAMAGNRRVRVTLDSTARTVEVEGGRWRRLPREVTFSLSPPAGRGRWELSFHPDGSSSGGGLLISSQGRTWSLVVEELTGRVRRRHAR